MSFTQVSQTEKKKISNLFHEGPQQTRGQHGPDSQTLFLLVVRDVNSQSLNEGPPLGNGFFVGSSYISVMEGVLENLSLQY